MSAEAQARLKFDVTAFRNSLAGAAAGWRHFAGNLKSEGAAAGRMLAPVAGAVTKIGIAATGAAVAGGGLFAWMLKDGVALNSQLEQASATFTAFTKDASLAQQIVADIKKEADVTPFDTNEMITAGKALISSAKGSREELMKLIRTAEVLAALNPAQGLEGAAFALREAMGGDFVSLQSRFDISRNVIKELKAQGKEGLNLVNAALEQMGAGPDLVAKLATSFDGLSSTAGSFFDNLKQTAAKPLFDTLKKELVDFVDFMDGDAGKSADEFARAFGENFNEGVKDVFGAIKSIDWKTAAEGAKAFALGLGEAASNAAALVASLPDQKATFGNGIDKFGKAVVQVGMAGLNVPQVRFVAGMSGLGDELEAANKAGQAEIARLDSNIAARNQARGARDAAQNRQAREALQAPVTGNELLDNWLQTRGKTRADINKDQKLKAEVYQRFPIQVTMVETNPMHTVMAT